MPHSINYNSRQELRAFLDERGLGMRKKYGQNFLVNPAVRSRLLDALELPPGETVWEIGPGLGAMTGELLERGGKVTAFEIDPAFVRLLKEFFGADPSFTLIEGDALKTWPPLRSGKMPFLLGNLPYNIAAALLADFIEKGMFFTRMVVTVQKEVARRMCAKPGSADYSSFSVLCASVYKITPLKVIPGASFFPAPRVESQGVRLDLPAEREVLPPLFYPLVRFLFSLRRKTIKNTLTAFASSVILKRETFAGPERRAGGPKEAAEAALDRAGLSGERRAETLDIRDFAALAASLEDSVLYGR